MQKELRILFYAVLITGIVSPLVATSSTAGPKLITRLLSALRFNPAAVSYNSHKEPSFFQEEWTEGKKWAYKFQRLNQTRVVKNESFEVFADKLVKQAVQYDNPVATLDTIRKGYFTDMAHQITWHKWCGQSYKPLGQQLALLKSSGQPPTRSQIIDLVPRLRDQLPYGYADSLYTLFTNESSIFKPEIPIIDPASLEADTVGWLAGNYNDAQKHMILHHAIVGSVPYMVKHGHPKLVLRMLINKYLEFLKKQKAQDV